MGDVVLASSVFPFVKMQYPDAEIHFATGAPYSDLFVHDPRLSRVYRFENPADRALLDRISWDRVIDLQNNGRSRRFSRKLVPASRVTRFDKCHLARLALLFGRVDLFDGARTVAARYLEAAGGGRNTRPAAPALLLGPEDAAAATPLIDRLLAPLDRSRPMLGLAPFAAWKNKVWNAANYAVVARAFIDKGWNVIVFGGPDDASAGGDFAAVIGTGAVSTAGTIPLPACAVLLGRCALCLGNDTGLCHLARAVGVKTGIIYGSTTRQWGFFPEGAPAFRVFESRTLCRPCHAHGGNICYRGSRPCLTRVQPARVVRAMEELAEERA
jgi:heptosyltransferase II